MKHYLLADPNGLIITSNLKDACKTCQEGCHSPGKVIEVCPIYYHKRRLGEIKTNSGSTFLCCDQTKTTKLFRNKLEGLSYGLTDLTLLKEGIEDEIKLKSQKRVNRLVHNLTSINAHNIQEVYDLVSQEVLTSNFNDQIREIQKEITSDPKNAALIFLRIAKHNIHMKSEFSIYKKLDRANPTLDRRRHIIHKVFMNVLHTFFADFSDREVYVNVDDCRESVSCDYESIQVALYHIIENSAKYVKPKTTINVSFRVLGEFIELSLKMISLYIEPEERTKIFDEGYSGNEAKKIQRNGEGIGLWRVKQMLDLNNSSINIIAGDNTEDTMGFRFANNEIRVKLEKY